MKKIPLTQGKFAIVDDDDYSYLMRWKWYAWKCGKTWYARRNKFPQGGSKKRDVIYMHRAIIATSQNEMVDHRNHDGLDNRRNNIRKCTKAQNQQNQLPKDGGESRYKGVSRESSDKWRARISYMGERLYLGSYPTEIEAAIAYGKKAKELFGEFAEIGLIAAALAEGAK